MKKTKTPDWVVRLMESNDEDYYDINRFPWIIALGCVVFAALAIFAIVVMVYN